MILRLFTVFHLNLAYSSIEEAQRAEVVRRAYRPLLDIARRLHLPLGIEAPAYTLEAAGEIDGEWLGELRALVADGPCEFVGSGYAQIIGPLVPSEVNAANLRLGNQAYQRMLGFQPMLALVNEQAYSAGMVPHYLEAGYRGIVMEWDNPAAVHPEWSSDWRYLPQLACGPDGSVIPLLWNKSLAFQKFQRYVHGEIEIDEYIAYLTSHVGPTTRAFPLYGNDIEVFDFRPGRYGTEASLADGVEWQRIEHLFATLLADPRFEFVRPSAVLEMLGEAGAGNRLRLETAAQPVPVKKQGKYNITRWAVTARDDLRVNTACWRAYERLKGNAAATEDDWRELCYLWSSDFRTHITPTRWAEYQDRLDAFGQQVDAAPPSPASRPIDPPERRATTPPAESLARLEGRLLSVQSESATLVLNTRRGLAIERLIFPAVADQPLIGTLAHGYYDDISLGADFYSGHLVLEPPGAPKVTDLGPTQHEVYRTADGVEVAGVVATPLGPVRKRWSVSDSEPVVRLSYELDWEALPIASFRLGFVTLIPDAFDRDRLAYACHNGGGTERFLLSGTEVDHGRPVSSLVSAAGGIGLTEGEVEVGDRDRAVRIEIDRSCSAMIGMVTYREVRGTFFCRVAFSVFEVDETSRLGEQAQTPGSIRFIIRGLPTAGSHAGAPSA